MYTVCLTYTNLQRCVLTQPPKVFIFDQKTQINFHLRFKHILLLGDNLQFIYDRQFLDQYEVSINSGT